MPRKARDSPLLPSVLAIGVLTVLAVVFVASSLRRPELPTFAPTPGNPEEVGDALSPPTLYTVDARDPDRWRYFDFSRGSVVEAPGPLAWDLAFRRTRIAANGGPGFGGRGGIVELGDVPFDSVRAVPDTGYVPTAADTANAAVESWYDYSMMSHVLTPWPRSYAVRTADGRYAKMEIVGYYCPDASAGCLTFRYRYQGDGSRSVEPGDG